MREVQFQAVAIASLIVALLALVRVWQLRRQVVRRVASVISRLEQVGTVDVVGKGGLEASLAALERAAGTGVLRVNDAEVSVERLMDAFRLVGHGVIVCDDNGETVFRNDHAEELMGARMDEPVADEAAQRLLQAAIQGEARVETLELFGPPRRVLTVRAAPVVNHSKLIGGVAVIEDVSERRRLEAVRRDFVANISHELKTPVGALAVLADTLVGETDRKVTSRLVERMQGEATRVARIIDDLLDLSRIESEESPMREPVQVQLVLAEAAERVRGAAEHRGVQLEVHEPPRRLTVLGDRRQLVSAMHSLIENAVAYSSEGDSVTVDTRTNGTWVEITVVDRGTGIPARDLERIFERFYRVDRGRARETGGTGLGLAIVRHVASSHGGEVRVQSREGVGSTFTLKIPAGPGPVAVTAEAG